MLRNFYYICTKSNQSGWEGESKSECGGRERDCIVRVTFLIWCHRICISYLHVECSPDTLCVQGEDKQDGIVEDMNVLTCKAY